MPYKNKDAQRAYQNNWLKTRRLAWINEHGLCKKCGSNLDLEIHHSLQFVKGIIAPKIWSYSKEKRDIELASCIVLCKICHKEETAKQRPEIKHGSSTGYKYGCRCQLCTDRKNLCNRRYLRNKKLKEVNNVAK